ncbi:MAG: hypothetical protein M1823_003974 [Watsoniomyces obsoletus]|nr:MAG: hypothetical protein M1823_003974 [Watsoniomyces obsoletus]
MSTEEATSDPGGPAEVPIDLMNDPPSAKRSRGDKDTMGEADTCRICRGEGTAEEPLFHPCRCSGSIKFVHQDCLMEWLSHSHKKYCELCKTHFRFTKMYDPQMPPSIPVPVLFRQLGSHAADALRTWSRAFLVGLVWLGWLPWSMRVGWRVLFWFGDGGWATAEMQAMPHRDAADTLEALRRTIEEAPSSSDRIRHPFGSPMMLGDYVDLASRSEPAGFPVETELARSRLSIVGRTILAFLGLAESSPAVPRPKLPEVGYMASNVTQHPSLLSNVTYLNSLTPSASLNKVIIDILEGQIITLLVVLAFVLIFLIREWVVQQQFGIDIGVDVNGELAPADAPNAAGEPHREPARPPVEDGAEEPDRASAVSGSTLEGTESPPDHSLSAGGLMDGSSFPQDHQSGRLWGVSRSSGVNRADSNAPEGGSSSIATSENAASENVVRSNAFKAGSGSTQQPSLVPEISEPPSPSRQRRPRLPARSSSFAASQIQRLIEEESRIREDLPKPEDVVRIWRQADGRTEDFVKIVREEGRAAELTWLTKALELLRQVDTHQEAKGYDRTDDLVGQPESSRTLHATAGLSSGFENARSSNVHVDKGKEVARDIETYLESTTTGDRRSSTSALPGSTHDRQSADQKFDGRILEGRSNGRSTPGFGGSQADSDESSLPSRTSSITRHHRHDRRGVTPGNFSEAGTRAPGSQFSSRASSPGRNQTPSDAWATIGDEPSETGEIDAAQDDIAATTMNARPSAAPLPAAHAAPRNILARAMDWCWGGVGEEQFAFENFDRVRQNMAIGPPVLDGPGLPGRRPQDMGDLEGHAGDEDEGHDDVDEEEDVSSDEDDDDDEDDEDNENDPNNDPNQQGIIDDAEDFDGVMELIGFRGPLTGLFQNAMFSSVLLSATISGGIWVPYVWGKVVLVLLAHPFSLIITLPLRWLSIISELVVDVALVCAGSAFSWLDYLARLLLSPLAPTFPVLGRYVGTNIVASFAQSVVERSLHRIAKLLVATSIGFSAADYPIFSIVAYESLTTLKSLVLGALTFVSSPAISLYRSGPRLFWSSLRTVAVESWTSFSVRAFTDQLQHAYADLKTIFLNPPSLSSFSALKYALATSSPISKPESSAIHWTATDRIIAIVAGYTFFSLMGALYVKRRAPFSTSEQGKRVEAIMQSILIQAGGVLKVIVIISVEMIAFPLYCGMLLDLALLPVFGGATVGSRIDFTLRSPWTSAFVHWFIGTCYMFHFALFVSMCRRILREGVLYFIRDPDDPNFHPVRDVLEKNVASQLRKIAFSALVYGALVIFCLGGIVWGLGRITNVLPIHWSSNEPVLEFPIDLLFYNFMMPSAIVFLQPSKGVQALYGWWFRRCARLLRLTHFLFGVPQRDEQGHYKRWRWVHAWARPFRHTIEAEERSAARVSAREPQPSPEFVQDGRFVRTPNSDQVRISKGTPAFQEIDDHDLDQPQDIAIPRSFRDDNRDLYTQVYIPPMFRVRIGAFIFLIWIFAAVTGVSLTIVPLVFGRMVLAAMMPRHLRTNDVYAFSIGLYLLGGVAYAALHLRRAHLWVRRTKVDAASMQYAAQTACHYGLRALSLLYIVVTLGIILPALSALLVELYVVLPAHTYLAAHERHIIDLVQGWTLGILYVNILGRAILWYPHLRPARALRAIARNGWLNPDVRLATRSVIVPATVVMVFTALTPLLLGRLAILLGLDHVLGLGPSTVYRFSYPAVLGLAVGLLVARELRSTAQQWQQSIRDEVYLVGQRLHNLGESRHGHGQGSPVTGMV